MFFFLEREPESLKKKSKKRQEGRRKKKNLKPAEARTRCVQHRNDPARSKPLFKKTDLKRKGEKESLKGS
jgi:hypothetical protein